MNNLLEILNKKYSQKKPFVAYCKPNQDRVVALFQNSDEVNFINDFTESGFVFFTFDCSQKIFFSKNDCEILITKKETFLNEIFPSNKKLDIDENAKKEFEKIVEKAIQFIDNGVIKKVVLSRKTVFEKDINEIGILFNILLIQNANAFCYVFFHPSVGLWMGATPEQLLKRKEEIIETVSLAGTQLKNNEKPIIWQNKEKEEQEIVTSYIENVLKESLTDVWREPVKTIEAGSLVHLKTVIQAKITDQTSLERIIEKLHPTPAVCGFPKENALKIITDLEQYDRKFYSGFIGEWNIDFLSGKNNSCDLYVNLRCLEYHNKCVNLYAGCGITQDSIPEKEFFETHFKQQTVFSVL